MYVCMYVCIVITHLLGRHGVTGHVSHIYSAFFRYFDPVPLLKEIQHNTEKQTLRTMQLIVVVVVVAVMKMVHILLLYWKTNL